jgi:hypothetical protein
MKFFTFLLLLVTLGVAQEDSSWGVEINPASVTMLSTGTDTKVFSGVISHFNQSDATELALSFVYEKGYADIFGSSYEDDNSFIYDESSSKAVNLTLHYRKFIRNKTNGFYYGGFGSYTYLDGPLKKGNQLATVKKVGLGAEIGLRIMRTDTNWSFYWGPALRIGGYLGSNNDVFHSDDIAFDLYDKQFFVDVDFMRIGFRF